MTERRYQEAEIRKILELATRQPGTSTPATRTDGLTLAEIQDIGQEVGVEPAAIARAAATLETDEPGPRRSFGMPIEVAHTVHLPRALTASEWEQLVASLRSTFRARGMVTGAGNTREWSNGNLHICHEPAIGGYRLRMGTVKGDASGWNVLGTMGIGTSAIVAGSLLLSGEPIAALLTAVGIGAAGIGTILGNALRLPRWRERRRRQMRDIAARVVAMVRSPPDRPQHSTEGQPD